MGGRAATSAAHLVLDTDIPIEFGFFNVFQFENIRNKSLKLQGSTDLQTGNVDVYKYVDWMFYRLPSITKSNKTIRPKKFHFYSPEVTTFLSIPGESCIDGFQ